ncbi:MAG: DUF3810 domain-containing protein [Christensenellales bacterium]|jgi:hypothetical protein
MPKKRRLQNNRLPHSDKTFLFLLLSWPAAAVLAVLAVSVPGFAQGYSATVYRVFNWALGGLFGLLPFSLAEILVYVLCAALLFLLFYWLYRMVRAAGRFWTVLLRGLLRIASIAGITLFAYLLLWGVNYHRPPFAELSGLPVRKASTDELYALCKSLAADANSLRSPSYDDENGVFTLPYDHTTLFSQVSEGYRYAAEDYPVLQGVTGPPKAVLYSKGLSAMGISGIYIPFTFEANVNIDTPDVSQPFAACHEAAHLLGFAREDEANFIAYLACRYHKSPAFSYSGAYTALIYATNALHSASPSLYDDVMSLVSESVKQDMRYSTNYWDSFKGPIMDAQQQINDRYLKAQGQQDGVASYGRMVDLLLALHHQENPT